MSYHKVAKSKRIRKKKDRGQYQRRKEREAQRAAEAAAIPDAVDARPLLSALGWCTTGKRKSDELQPDVPRSAPHHDAATADSSWTAWGWKVLSKLDVFGLVSAPNKRKATETGEPPLKAMKTEDGRRVKIEHGIGLRSLTATARAEEDEAIVRDVSPPPLDKKFREMIEGKREGMGRDPYLSSPPMDTEREAQIKSTLTWLGSQASVELKENVRMGRNARSRVERWNTDDSYFHTNVGNSAIEAGIKGEPGFFAIDYAQLANVTVPTRLIGHKEHKLVKEKDVEKEVEPQYRARGSPLIPSHWGEAPEPSYTKYGPFYKCGTKKSHLIRVGDYLGPAAISRAYQICGGNHWNFAAVLLITCHAVFHQRAKADEEEPTYNLQEELSTVEQVAIELEGVFDRGMPSLPGQPIRSVWVTWNPFNPEYDKHYSGAMLEWRKALRKRCADERGYDEDRQVGEFQKISFLFYFIIMIHSASTKDGVNETTFYKIVNGRHDCRSFLAPLAKRPIQEVFQYYRSRYHSMGVHGTCAHALLTFLIPLFVLDSEKMSDKLRTLTSFPEVGNKKSRIALNAHGLYRGVGADRWVLRFLGIFIEDMSKADRLRRAQYLAGKISKEAGLNLNDNVGELCQQYGKGGAAREWAIAQFDELAKRNESFAQVYDRWMGVLEGVKNEFLLESKNF